MTPLADEISVETQSRATIFRNRYSVKFQAIVMRCALQLPGGAKRFSWPVLLALFIITQPAWAGVPTQRGGRFALLVSVAGPGGQSRFPGAQRDLDLARAVVKSAGVPDGNILTLRDREASGEGIRQALSDLALRLAPADRALISFSGFGQRRADADRPGGCEEVFLAADGEALGYGELAAQLIPVVERAEKTVVFFDSCAAPQNGVGAGTARCLPAPASSACRFDANTRWRNFTAEIRKAGVPATNIVSVHLGRPGKGAFDDAPAAVSRCLLNEAPDSDQSGAVSIAEMSGCVQQVVDRSAGTGNALLTLNGNSAFVLTMPRGDGRGPITRLFNDVVAGRDGRKQMLLENARTSGDSEGPVITLRSSAVGYLYLIASEGDDALRLVYPVAADGSNRLVAGASFRYPRSGRSPLVTGTSLLAILADNERDLALLPAAPGQPFSADAGARKALHDFATTSLRAAEAPCQANGKERNLSLWRACSDAYGAAVIVITPK